MFRPDQVDTVMFDSFSTVVDEDTATEVLKDHVDNPDHVSWLWRSRVSSYRPLSNYIGYVSHHEINRSALEYVFEILDVDVADEEIDEIARVYHDMDPFDDVRGGMEELKNAGYDIYILSNGDKNVLGSMLENAEIEPLIEETISANEIKTYKPHVRLYKHAAERASTPVKKIAYGTSTWYDLQGGMYAGMQGIWINRKERPEGLKPFNGSPDSEVKSFYELADELKSGDEQLASD